MYWNKERSPIRWENQILSVAWLSCACKCSHSRAEAMNLEQNKLETPPQKKKKTKKVQWAQLKFKLSLVRRMSAFRLLHLIRHFVMFLELNGTKHLLFCLFIHYEKRNPLLFVTLVAVGISMSLCLHLWKDQWTVKVRPWPTGSSLTHSLRGGTVTTAPSWISRKGPFQVEMKKVPL